MFDLRKVLIDNYCFILLCIFSGLVFCLGMTLTPGYSPDSIRYMDNANSIIKENFWHHIVGTSWDVTVVPPLFKYFIASFMLLGVDVETAAKLVPLISMTLLPFPLFFIINELLASKKLGLVSVIFFLTMVPTWYIGNYVWTEMPFTFLIVMGFLFTLKYFKAPLHLYLILMSFFLSLASLTRWAGILFGLSVLFMIFFKAFKDKRYSLYQIILFCIVTFLPVMLLLIKNKFFTEDIYYVDAKKSELILSTDAIRDTILTIPVDFSISSKEYLQKLLEIHPNLILIIPIIFLATLVILWIFGYKKHSKTELADYKYEYYTLISLSTVVYLTGIITLSSVYKFDNINTRLTFPIYPCIFILIAFFFHLWILKISKPCRGHVCSTLVIIILLLSACNMDDLYLWTDKNEVWCGFSSSAYTLLKQSESGQYLTLNWDGSDIHSNLDTEYAVSFHIFGNKSLILHSNGRIPKMREKDYILLINDERIWGSNLSMISHFHDYFKSDKGFLNIIKEDKYELWRYIVV